MKTFWKTYVAVALLAGLGAYIYFVERKRPADTGDEPREKVFASLEKDKVQALSLTPAAGETIRVVRKDEGWVMTAPMSVPASSTDVDGLLASLENLEMSEVVSEDGAGAAAFGLETPQLTVGVQLEGASEPMKLQLGGKTPDDTNLYARIATQPRIFTLPGYIENTFKKTPFDLRDRDLLHVKRDAVKTLTIVGPDERYVLEREGEDAWVFSEPVRTWAGRWSVDGLLGAIETLRMESVAAEPAEDLAKYGLSDPRRVVTMGLADGTTKSLEIGSPAPDEKHYARAGGGDLVAVINKTIVDDLAKGMESLRAKRLLDISVYDVNGFDVIAAGATSTYARSASKDGDGIEVYSWKRTAPEAKELETNAVQDVLFKIGGVEVGQFIDDPGPANAYGLEKPEIKVELRFTDDKPAASFDLGQKDGNWYARRPGDAAVLRLDASKAEDLFKAFTGL